MAVEKDSWISDCVISATKQVWDVDQAPGRVLLQLYLYKSNILSDSWLEKSKQGIWSTWEFLLYVHVCSFVCNCLVFSPLKYQVKFNLDDIFLFMCWNDIIWHYNYDSFFHRCENPNEHINIYFPHHLHLQWFPSGAEYI